MASGINDESKVIDETFLGLERPRNITQLGRPDIKDGRPGEALVKEVQSFVRDGGKETLKAERRKASGEPDAPSKPQAPDHGFKVPSALRGESDDQTNETR